MYFILYQSNQENTEKKSQEETYEFTIQHFLSPDSLTHKRFLAPWSRKITEESKNRIRFVIFPSMTLGGKPNELYNQVRDGVVDIAWTLIGYTPGVFPLTEVFELPTVHHGNALATTLALQETLPLLQDDFQAIKVLLLHTHSGNSFHFGKDFTGKMGDFNDFAGLKIRTPSRTGAWMLEMLDAHAVGMPVPDIPQSLAKQVIAGALIPFEIALTLKIPELSNLSVKGINNRRLGTSVFLLAMNLAKFNQLPEDLKKIMEDNSHKNIAETIARLWEEAEAKGEQAQIASGGEIMELSDAFWKTFDEKAQALDERWLSSFPENEREKAQQLLLAAKKSVKKFTP